MGLVAYNLIRTVMVDAARRRRVTVARISFTGTLNRLREFAAGELVRRDASAAYGMLLDHLGRDLIPLDRTASNPGPSNGDRKTTKGSRPHGTSSASAHTETATEPP